MSRSMTERRLRKLAEQLTRLREELRVVDEQLAHFAEIADDTRLRALVSETPVAGQEHREAQRHADAMARHRTEMIAELSRLEAAQDELLDQFMAEGR